MRREELSGEERRDKEEAKKKRIPICGRVVEEGGRGRGVGARGGDSRKARVG
jgi:hypothetical protein